MKLLDVTLEDKYDREHGRIFLTGIQALVRLPLMQIQRDRAGGLDTGGYITGYRGSPLGSYDQELERANHRLQGHGIIHQPAVNEELAATSCSGTQQVGLEIPGRHRDGVFAIWYGKGPGVDRSGDAIRHGNLFGASKNGGVLMLIGDDHLCESSTTAHASEYAMVDGNIPILNPAGVQDILEYGLYGIAMSRYSGSWISLKCVHDTVESTVSMDLAETMAPITWPEGRRSADANITFEEFHLGITAAAQMQERRIYEDKLPAAQAFVLANGLDRVVIDPPKARLGVIASGKSYLDLIQAMADLGIDGRSARELGLRVYKPALTWPLEPSALKRFAGGLESILVIEDKRPLIEDQVRSILYGMRQAPHVLGKRDRGGGLLLQSFGSLTTNDVARSLGRELLRLGPNDCVQQRLERLDRLSERAGAAPSMARLPYFCAGCPHSTSTVVPEGSNAVAGIGCHVMAKWMDRNTHRFTQMGGEGASWVGEAPFSAREHMFQNVGDGTFYHSGSLVVRHAVASGVSMTFKILYNDAVAMTGGQKMEIGNLTVPQIAGLLEAEGVRRTVVVTDEPEKYAKTMHWPTTCSVHHRREFDEVQRQLRETQGVTALIYDQTCAAEKRRRRKRGEFPDPDERIAINERVCEGCGDCGVQSNCVAILPKETEFGRKRRIDQSVCNKDFSCLKGFCPSFVSIKGAKLKASAKQQCDWPLPPEPNIPELTRAFGILITGIGGTGVITIAAILGMAAHLEQKGCAGLDMIGMAQKGGAVLSHLKIAPKPEDVGSARLSAGGADLVLACDRVVAAQPGSTVTMEPGRTRAVVNLEAVMTGDFTRQPDFEFPNAQLNRIFDGTLGAEAWQGVEASELARRLVGDAIGANLFLVGFAYQKGYLPLSSDAVERAIELNGVAVAMNREVFRWGRQAAVDLGAVIKRAGLGDDGAPVLEDMPLSEVIERRARELEAYQSRRYAGRYRTFVEDVLAKERAVDLESDAITRTVADNLFKLMAYKDEYEVARLYTDGAFRKQIATEFEDGYRLEVHLAPPLFSRIDPRTGRPKKFRFGPWMLKVLSFVRHGKFLRGSVLDPFGWSEERRLERGLIKAYRSDIERLVNRLDAGNYEVALAIAKLAQKIRGFGPVKRRSIDLVMEERERLWEEFENSGQPNRGEALQAAE